VRKSNGKKANSAMQKNFILLDIILKNLTKIYKYGGCNNTASNFCREGICRIQKVEMLLIE
jgi:hypothetical protein